MPENPLEERAVRLEKLQSIIADGVNPYPSTSSRTHTIAEVLVQFDALVASAETVTVVGRLKALRGHGGACFADLEDGTEKIQLHLKIDLLGAETYQFFEKNIDRGDFLQVSGKVCATKRGEKTIEISALTLLTKTLHPLPDKWAGLNDIETRYRQRYLDLVANPEVREIFRKRSLIVQTIREFFLAEGFMEVETPVLQPIAGGASAKPFVTHHNALDIDLYLRIAPELYLKRLIAGGFERVFEIGRCFRNEGIDHLHNPEFTSIEFYQAYANYHDLMKLTEHLLPNIVEKVCKGNVVTFDGIDIDFTAPYPRLTFREALVQYADIDIEAYPDKKSLAKVATKVNLPVTPSDDRPNILDNLYKKFVRSAIVNPTFITDHPTEILPLAKRTSANENYVESFQLIVGKGIELIKAFSELNDPLDQRKRFADQERMRQQGDEEAQRIDEDFIEALEVGLPPTAGFGMGIDRLVALLTGQHSIKEVILFPTLRP